MNPSTTWDNIRFAATPEGATATDLDTGKSLNILRLICSTNRGYIYRGSAGNYPWGSAVILIIKVDDKLEAYAYPTEINAKGTLEVERDLWETMAMLQPKIYLPIEPRSNFHNGCYEWELSLEGKANVAKAIEVGSVQDVDQAWAVGYNNTVVTLQKSTGNIWTREGYESYRYLAEDMLEQLKNTVVTDEDDDSYEDYLDEFEEE